MFTNPALARDGDATWKLWMASVTDLLSAGVSVVTDQTLYLGRSESDLRSRVLPLAHAVNVHLRCQEASARWRAKIAQDDRWSAGERKRLFQQAGRNAELWTEPLDLGCLLFEVETTFGDTPSIARLVQTIEASYQPASR